MPFTRGCGTTLPANAATDARQRRGILLSSGSLEAVVNWKPARTFEVNVVHGGHVTNKLASAPHSCLVNVVKESADEIVREATRPGLRRLCEHVEKGHAEAGVRPRQN